MGRERCGRLRGGRTRKRAHSTRSWGGGPHRVIHPRRSARRCSAAPPAELPPSHPRGRSLLKALKSSQSSQYQRKKMLCWCVKKKSRDFFFGHFPPHEVARTHERAATDRRDALRDEADRQQQGPRRRIRPPPGRRSTRGEGTWARYNNRGMSSRVHGWSSIGCDLSAHASPPAWALPRASAAAGKRHFRALASGASVRSLMARSAECVARDVRRGLSA